MMAEVTETQAADGNSTSQPEIKTTPSSTANLEEVSITVGFNDACSGCNDACDLNITDKTRLSDG